MARCRLTNDPQNGNSRKFSMEDWKEKLFRSHFRLANRSAHSLGRYPGIYLSTGHRILSVNLGKTWPSIQRLGRQLYIFYKSNFQRPPMVACCWQGVIVLYILRDAVYSSAKPNLDCSCVDSFCHPVSCTGP